MTKSPGCRDIERLLLEQEDRNLAAGERRFVEDHLHGCAPCRQFAEDRTLIREGAAGLSWPEPPEELVRRTRRKLDDASKTGPAVLPAWVLVALAMIAIATSIWLAFNLPDITPGSRLVDLPFAALAAVFVIVQNALMLFCSPLILRSARAQRNEPEGARS